MVDDPSQCAAGRVDRNHRTPENPRGARRHTTRAPRGGLADGRSQVIVCDDGRPMFLNEFAESLAPRDMTRSPEFASLLDSAGDLGIPHNTNVRYVSRHTVIRSHRFHFTEWGEPGRPQVLLLHGGN